jgi:hypothetical protein
MLEWLFTVVCSTTSKTGWYYIYVNVENDVYAEMFVYCRVFRLAWKHVYCARIGIDPIDC